MSRFTGSPLSISGPSLGGTPCDDGGDYAILDRHGHIIGEAYFWTDGDITRPAKENAELWVKSPIYHEVLTRIANEAEYYRSAINDRSEGMSALEDIAMLAEEALGKEI